MFLNPLGLLALLGVPAVLALHLFRRRFQRRRVSALFLWESRTTTTLSGRRRERLLRSPSFWSEMLVALLLALAFAGPRACGTLRARHLVVVLDGSASMEARSGLTDENAQTFAELARAEIERRVGALPSGSRVTVVESGPVPHILIGPAAFPEESLSELANYQPRAGRHDLMPSLSLGLELAGTGSVTLLTDQFAPEGLPPEVSVVALGSALENLAITRATRLRGGEEGPGRERILITVANFAPRSRLAQVVLETQEEVLATKELELEAGDRQHFRFEVPVGTPALVARLEGDRFPIDDTALLLPPPPRTLALAAQLDEDEHRHLGLRSAGSADPIDRWLSLISESSAATELEGADVAIAHEVVGGPATWCLTLEADGSERLDLLGPFLVEKRHPLLAGVTLDGVVWSSCEGLVLAGTPLISAGNLPLLTEERVEDRLVFHLNIDWRRSSLHRSPDWPILLDNLAELRRRELEGPRQVNLAAGEVFYYKGRGPADYVLRGPDGERELRALDTLAVEDLEAIGAYDLLRDGESVSRFAVHFGDDAESNLQRLSAGERLSAIELAEERAGSSWVVQLLAVGAMLALLLDWFFLRPRGPVTEVANAKPSRAGRRDV